MNETASIAHAKAQQLAAASCERALLRAISEHCDPGFALTLQTRLRPCGRTPAQLRRMHEQALIALKCFLPRLNRALTGNGWRRRDQLLPIFAAVVEGLRADTAHTNTVHIHAMLGNVRPSFTLDELSDQVRALWCERTHNIGTHDTHIKPLHSSRWAEHYMTKEQRLGQLERIEWDVLQLPTSVRNAVMVQ